MGRKGSNWAEQLELQRSIMLLKVRKWQQTFISSGHLINGCRLITYQNDEVISSHISIWMSRSIFLHCVQHMPTNTKTNRDLPCPSATLFLLLYGCWATWPYDMVFLTQMNRGQGRSHSQGRKYTQTKSDKARHPVGKDLEDPCHLPQYRRVTCFHLWMKQCEQCSPLMYLWKAAHKHRSFFCHRPHLRAVVTPVTTDKILSCLSFSSTLK